MARRLKMTQCIYTLSWFVSRPDQRWPPHKGRDKEVPEAAEHLLLQWGPETSLPADGKRLLAQIPPLWRLPVPEAQVKDPLVHLSEKQGDRHTVILS